MLKKVMGWFLSISLLLNLSFSALAEAADAGAAGAGSTAGAAAATGAGAYSQILLLVAFGLIFYFIIMRPQSKRAKEHRQLVTNLQKGDEVITSGGILGKVTNVTDNFLILMIADGVEVPVQKQAIAMTVPKGTLKSLT